uniref:Uncharacterized protein n=1 Tax=Vespula pensylvanica TaxID=30213 RepID=A0A834NXH4_VESPE|nr:hypothetical protein H0235_010541 [Vespula pensylvanica]
MLLDPASVALGDLHTGLMTGSCRAENLLTRSPMSGYFAPQRDRLINDRYAELSPVQVPPAMPAGEMLLLVDLIELARAIDRH